MSRQGMAEIKDYVDRIVIIMSNDLFTREELEVIKKTGEKLAASTQKVIDRADAPKEKV